MCGAYFSPTQIIPRIMGLLNIYSFSSIKAVEEQNIKLFWINYRFFNLEWKKDRKDRGWVCCLPNPYAVTCFMRVNIFLMKLLFVHEIFNTYIIFPHKNLICLENLMKWYFWHKKLHVWYKYTNCVLMWIYQSRIWQKHFLSVGVWILWWRILMQILNSISV